jgi:hypothetical protein
MPVRIAGIGTRDLPPEEVLVCEKVGQFCAEQGIRVSSGNATGADQAFGRGVNSVDPTMLDVALPWPSYNREAIVVGNVIRSEPPVEYFEMAAANHQAWDRCSDGAKLLHTRNVMILMPEPDEKVDLVLALPNTTKGWGGGTGFGMKLASHVLDIEVLNIRYWDDENLFRLCERLRGMVNA